jgi:NitT/TauT family transport system substrate-binding protein
MALGRGTGPGASALLVLADQQGFLKARGLDAEVRAFPSNGDSASAMLAGDTAGAIGSSSIVNSLLGRDADIKDIALVSRSPRDAKVVVTSDINKPADLKGKKVAVVSGTSSELGMGLFLANGGLTMKDVQVVKADAPEVVAVMARGDAQAFYLWEPFPSRALQTMGDRLKVVAVAEDLGNQGTLHQLLSGKFLATNPDAATRLLNAYLDAEKFWNQNPQKSSEILAEQNKLPVAEAKSALDASVFEIRFDDYIAGELKADAEWQVDGGRLKAVPDYSKALDPSYLKKLDASRVTLKS